jgi:EAL domain-containing protein (putative c-di-GMP-specific phosphodiesterase class I)
MGLMLCMDDFGSGYSSLNMLKDVPFDILKIDKDFFSEADTSRDTKIIMQHIVGMATELGIEVVCEGVETDEQAKFLEEVSCGRLQGYLYGKPLSYDELLEKIQKGEYSIADEKIN